MHQKELNLYYLNFRLNLSYQFKICFYCNQIKFQVQVSESPNLVICSVYFSKLLFKTFSSYRGVFMEFYRRNDITLGGFLERYCFRQVNGKLCFFSINKCSKLVFLITPFQICTILEFYLYPLLYPVGNYMIKVNNRNTRTRGEICSKLTIKIPERRLASFCYLSC